MPGPFIYFACVIRRNLSKIIFDKIDLIIYLCCIRKSVLTSTIRNNYQSVIEFSNGVRQVYNALTAEATRHTGMNLTDDTITLDVISSSEFGITSLGVHPLGTSWYRLIPMY